jgi:hypothetical protein
MATHDYVIANGSGAAVRADLNDALAAIVTGNSNATAPTTTYAYEEWFDTSTSPTTIKRRDGSNASWITFGYADGSIDLGSATTPAIRFNGDTNTGIYSPGADQVAISTGGTQRATVDSSGRLLVGASSAPSATGPVQIVDTVSTVLVLARNDTSIVADNNVGEIRFFSNDSTAYEHCATIAATADGDYADGDKPTRLVFSTTADGASSPTARMTIKNNGDIVLGDGDAVSTTQNNIWFGNLTSTETQAVIVVVNREATDATALGVFNRQVSDGRLIQFRQANTTEGTISVSGTTVTYGGGHLARWSQLLNDEDPSDILKGTVMSNLDEMCQWGEEDNEQLNKTKVSDVEGDPNVAGVFVSTSFDEDGPLDFFVAMTGDMIIRIAEGVTVQRGDLLMSAGDGTAKPQDDDIVRNKTIAKVTSTHVSETYADGRYCVPCVLMAC